MHINFVVLLRPKLCIKLEFSVFGHVTLTARTLFRHTAAGTERQKIAVTARV